MVFTSQIILVYTIEAFSFDSESRNVFVNQEEGAENEKKWGISMKKVVVLTASGAFAVLAAVFLMINGRAKKIFASDTVVNEMDVSGMTQEDLEQQIRSYSLTVTYQDEKGGKASETISGADFGMALGDNAEAVSKILERQGIWQYLAGGGEEHELDGLIEYDKEALVSRVKQLACFDAESFISPEDAYISDYSETDGYRIVEETTGNIIDEERAQELILKAVQGMEQKIDLSEGDCYQKAEVTSEDKRLNRTLEQLNKFAGAKITYNFDSKKEVLSGKTISKWLKVDKKGRVTIRKEKIAGYVSKLRRRHDTIFSTRKFKTSYGKMVTVTGGDYGWWMNSQKEEKELLKLIKAGKKVKRTPEYYQTAKSYGKKDYGDTYVEINLATQHVFLYVKGKKILETDCVTGNSSRGYDTPAGTYSITYTERNATLNGENYSTPVQYWMPFNRNIGLHDASWRSSFGGEIYKYNGSHGCVNLPPDKAAKLFRYVKKGMPVICYNYLPSTDNKKDQAKPAAKTDNQATQRTEQAKKNTDTVKKNKSATKKNSTTAKNKSTDKKNSTAVKNKSVDKKNNTATKNKSSDKKNSTAVKKKSTDKKSSTTAKNKSADKKNSTAAKNKSADKKNSTAAKNKSADKKSSTAAKNKSADKKNSTAAKNKNADKKSSTVREDSGSTVLE